MKERPPIYFDKIAFSWFQTIKLIAPTQKSPQLRNDWYKRYCCSQCWRAFKADGKIWGHQALDLHSGNGDPVQHCHKLGLLDLYQAETEDQWLHRNHSNTGLCLQSLAHDNRHGWILDCKNNELSRLLHVFSSPAANPGSLCHMLHFLICYLSHQVNNLVFVTENNVKDLSISNN